jgi:uncharacterized membrane protein
LKANVLFGVVFLVMGLTLAIRALQGGGLSPTAGLFFGLMLIGVGALRLWAGLKAHRT